MPRVLPSELYHLISSNKRPHHGPTQVRTLEGLKFGGIYKVFNHITRCAENILMVSKPRKDEHGCWQVKTVSWVNGRPTGEVQVKSCADLSIVPYQSGTWNTTKALFRTGRKNLPASIVIRFLQVKN